MRITKNLAVAGLFLVLAFTSTLGWGQGRGGGRGGAAAGASGAAGPARGAGGGGGRLDFPARPAGDPAMIAAGKILYDASCASCHAADARGTVNGINLIRKQVMMNDQNGELLGPILVKPHADGKAPAMTWSKEQVANAAAFIHSFRVAGYDNSRNAPAPDAILVGNAAAGEAYFKTTCAGCHSVTDVPSSAASLKGIGARILDPRTLQDTFVSGRGGRGGGRGGGGGGGNAVTITMPDGKQLKGNVNRVDDFLILMTDTEGVQHNIRRNGDVPKVEIKNPNQGHMDLLSKYTDTNIHNLTAYLVTLQ